jgi:hypothetical protein
VKRCVEGSSARVWHSPSHDRGRAAWKTGVGEQDRGGRRFWTRKHVAIRSGFHGLGEVNIGRHRHGCEGIVMDAAEIREGQDKEYMMEGGGRQPQARGCEDGAPEALISETTARACLTAS